MHTTIHNRVYLHIILKCAILSTLLLIGTVAFAAEPGKGYVPLVSLPQLQNTGGGLSGYFNQLYMIAVALGAILAFIKISIAGVKWSMSDIVTDKSDAKKDIQGALLGLAILLIPFIVLNTIYSGLTNLRVLDAGSSVQINTKGTFGETVTKQEQAITNITQQNAAQTGTLPAVWTRNCAVLHGQLIPGCNPETQTNCYTPETRDCSALTSRCQSSECNYGTPTVISNGAQVKCNYYVTMSGTTEGQISQVDTCPPK